jgi:hypothetical protein
MSDTTHEDGKCVIDVHPNRFDLRATLETTFHNETNPEEPVGFVHEGQTLIIKVRVGLSGGILDYLCNTQIGVCVGYESCGSGPEGELPPQWQTLSPCGQPDPYVLEFDFSLPGGVLVAGECGKVYGICITLSSKDCCGKVGFVFGSCEDFSITVLPADVSGTPA